MRKNNWNDQRIIYWQAVYERLIKDYKDKGIPVRIQRKPETPDELYGQVGKKIKALRKENRLTQKELAKKLGISQQIISHIEQGRANISLLTLKKVANALGTNVIIDLTK
jgi:DNA-binding XRE family transcriptional regulator